MLFAIRNHRLALSVFVLVASLSTAGSLALAESPAAAAATVGISSTKPGEGPFVEVDGKFMVPYTQKIPGTDLAIEMIPVPGGTFAFGASDEDEHAVDAEKPQVKVTVSPMWVAKTETTWAQYKEYMKLYSIFKGFESRGERVVEPSNLTDAITAPTELYEPDYTYEYGQDPDQAAVTMTQYAAQQYTKWLSLLTGSQYRLPTESEWEYACRAGTTTVYYWGDDADEIDEYAWYSENSDYEGQKKVALKKPNAFGLHDMLGNVAEWTVNAFNEDGNKWLAGKEPLDALATVKWPEQSSPCVVRGGSWEQEAAELRCSVRMASDDEVWKEDDPNFPRSPWWFTSDPARGIGFRIVRSYQPLDKELISKFWETSAENTKFEVETRVQGGRGGYGIVDPTLVEAIKKLDQ